MSAGPKDALAGRGAGFEMPTDTAVVARIAVVMGELAATASLPEIVDVVALHVRDAVEAAVSTLMLRDEDQLVMVGNNGVDTEKAARWSAFGIGDQNPCSEAARTGQPVVVATADEVALRYPLMVADTPPDRSVVNLPLLAVEEVIGVIGLTFEHNWLPGPIELDFLMTFANACAQAIRRVQATEHAARNGVRLEFLARASAELGSSLDYRATLANVARLSVPDLADWCAVDLLIGGDLKTLAVAHVDPAKVAWAWQLREKYPIDMGAPVGAANVVRTGVGELTRDITDQMLVASARDKEHLRLSRELNVRSAMIVPLIARDRTLGTITLLRTRSSRTFDASDLSVAEDLARRAGVAIDNARLYDETANVALELQRAVLPDALGQLPGWQTSAYYRADGRADVGGDFYDAVVLPDGRLAVFIGDVMGHGIRAAAAMAHMRAAIRALLCVDPDPQAVLDNLDRMFDQLHITSLVSLVYALVEPCGQVQLANAGSCPPLLLTCGGPADFLPNAGRPPLGVGPAATPLNHLHIQAGDTLLLYTDGLVERRHESLDTGLDRLAAQARQFCAEPLEDALAATVRATAGDDMHDDVAAIAIRRTS